MISIDFKLLPQHVRILQVQIDQAVKKSTSDFPKAILLFDVNGVNMGGYHNSAQETPILAFGMGLIFILNRVEPDGGHLLWHEDGEGGDLQFQRNGEDTITLSSTSNDIEATCDFDELKRAAECFGQHLLTYFEENFPEYVRAHPYLRSKLSAPSAERSEIDV